MQFLRIAVLALVVLPSCSAPHSLWKNGVECNLPATPPVQETTLGEPLACHEVQGNKCCSWAWDDCLHTFCNSQFECAWEYRKGLRLTGDKEECPVPTGFVHLEMTVPESFKALRAPKPM